MNRSDNVEIQKGLKGYVLTGEYRVPREGELYLLPEGALGQRVDSVVRAGNRVAVRFGILRPETTGLKVDDTVLVDDGGILGNFKGIGRVTRIRGDWVYVRPVASSHKSWDSPFDFHKSRVQALPKIAAPSDPWAGVCGFQKDYPPNIEAALGVDVDELVEELHGTPETDYSVGGHEKFEVEMKATNPKDAIGSDKLPLHLWPETATVMGTLGMLDGALKYGRTNWRVAGVRASIYIDAVKRHINAYTEGEDFDPDSGVPHLAHALACLAILVDADAAGKLTDDRQYPAGYRALVEELTPHVARLKDKHADKTPKHYTVADA